MPVSRPAHRFRLPVSLFTMFLALLLASCELTKEGATDPWLSKGLVVAPVTDISPGPGYSHTCAVRDDGTLWCWGRNHFGKLGDGTTLDSARAVQVGTDADWAHVSSGYDHTCGLKNSGLAWCWGWDGSTPAVWTTPGPQVSLGNGALWAHLSAANNYSCGIKADGTLWCWDVGQTAAPVQVGTDNTWNDIHIDALSNGCATKDDGSLWCWTGAGGVPGQVASAMPWMDFSKGNDFACGIKSDGTLWCWGTNGEGQLGDGTNMNSTTPVQVGTDSDWLNVSLGKMHACAVKNTGALFCWGNNGFGQLGDGTSTGLITGSASGSNQPVPAGAEISDWVTVTAGGYHTCAVRSDNTASCWGSNSTAQLGAASDVTPYRPAPTNSGGNWAQVDGSANHACGVRNDGTLWCWGNNTDGQLGTGTLRSYGVPVQEATGASDWAQVSAGYRQTCAIKTDNSLYCWGNRLDALVVPDPSVVPMVVDTPMRETGATNDWRHVSAGGFNTCATKTDGTLWCWASNTLFQIGTDTDWSVIVQSGSNLSPFPLRCALKTDGSLWCWGDISTSGLPHFDTFSPTQEPTAATDWVSVTVGDNHACALKGNGTLWCWGSGILTGDGTGNTSTAPVQEATKSTSWTQVAAGYGHTCATRADDSLWCWGVSIYGQTGSGDNATLLSPTPEVTGGTDWASVWAGGPTTHAIRRDGARWAWGFGGLLGDNRSWVETPVPVTFPIP